jgi:arylsulfatase A-like enzyme
VPRDHKFCLVKWFLDPHAPYRPPEKFRKKIPVVPGKLSHKPSFYSQKQHYDMKKFSDYEKYYLKELYKAEVASVDERVGYILKALDHRNLLDKTIIVFTSDHGEAFGEMKQWGHGTNFSECLVHVPLIFMGPGIPVGKIEEDIVSHLDLMPTLKTLLGIRYDENMQGKGYASLLHGETIPTRTPYFDRNRQPSPRVSFGDVDGLLMDGHKLTVKRKKDTVSFKLFNLTDDPEELNNLAKGKFKIVQKMLKKIMDIRKSNKARLKLNQKKINRNINMDKRWKKVRERLKTLGYIE